MPFCASLNCNNRTYRKHNEQAEKENVKNKRITFHMFPTSPNIKNAWLVNIGRKDWFPMKYSRICSEHFVPDDFIKFGRKTFLKKGAVPTKVLPTPAKYVSSNILNAPKNLIELDIEPLDCATDYITIAPSSSFENSSNCDVHMPDTLLYGEGSHGERRNNMDVNLLHNYTSFSGGAADHEYMDFEMLDPENSSTYSELDPNIAPTYSKQNPETTPTYSKLEKLKRVDAATSISPFRRRHRRLSTKTNALINKHQREEAKLKIKIKTLQKSKNYYVKKVADLQTVIQELKSKKLIDAQQEDFLKEICGPNRDILKRQLKKSKTAYSDELKAFALTLHLYSPAAYKYVRLSFDSCLPNPTYLRSWYSRIDGSPGFTQESFDTLKIVSKNCDHEILCNLVFDEISIMKNLNFNGVDHDGYVDLGIGFNTDDAAKEEATQALVFMLVCINRNWKISIGYFLINGMQAEMKSNLVKIAIGLAKESGVRVVGVTYDGFFTNASTAKALGCNFDDPNNLKTHFDFEGQKVYVFPDVCHNIKLVRNAFEHYRVFLDQNNQRIKFAYIVDLHDLQENRNMHLANKLKSSHVNFKRQIMKVYLATQLFSNSVSNAIQVCKDNLRLNYFNDADPTIEFIQIMNDLFDVFNSRNLTLHKFKKALNIQNENEIFRFLDTAKKFIINLKLEDGTYVINSRRKTGFLGFLISIESLRNMYEEIVKEKKVISYIPMYKFCQDHLEMWFSIVRLLGGRCNNPTKRIFMSSYKKLLLKTQIKESLNGNCLPLESIAILHAKLTPIQVLNGVNPDETAKKRVIAQTIVDMNQSAPKEFNFNDPKVSNFTNLDEFSEVAVTYIAGFVTRKLIQSIKCSNCVKSILDYSNFQNKSNIYCLVNVKDNGGLIYASEDVLNICRLSEQVFRATLQLKDDKTYGKSFKIGNQVNLVLHKIRDKQIHFFEANKGHFIGQSFIDNHYTHLLQAVADEYLRVRQYYVAKKIVDKSKSQRNVLNKLILNKNY